MPHRLCNEPRCPNQPTPRGRGYCRIHAALLERTRKKVGRKVYASQRWKNVRRRKLHLDPLCERCGAIATDVHHKHGVERVTWEVEGLESLCHSCHSKETRQHQIEGATR